MTFVLSIAAARPPHRVFAAVGLCAAFALVYAPGGALAGGMTAHKKVELRGAALASRPAATAAGAARLNSLSASLPAAAHTAMASHVSLVTGRAPATAARATFMTGRAPAMAARATLAATAGARAPTMASRTALAATGHASPMASHATFALASAAMSAKANPGTAKDRGLAGVRPPDQSR